MSFLKKIMQIKPEVRVEDIDSENALKKYLTRDVLKNSLKQKISTVDIDNISTEVTLSYLLTSETNIMRKMIHIGWYLNKTQNINKTTLLKLTKSLGVDVFNKMKCLTRIFDDRQFINSIEYTVNMLEGEEKIDESKFDESKFDDIYIKKLRGISEEISKMRYRYSDFYESLFGNDDDNDVDDNDTNDINDDTNDYIDDDRENAFKRIIEFKSFIEVDIIKLLLYHIYTNKPITHILKQTLLKYISEFNDQALMGGICSTLSFKYIRNMLLENMKISESFYSSCKEWNERYENVFDLELNDELDVVFAYTILMKNEVNKDLDVDDYIDNLIHEIATLIPDNPSESVVDNKISILNPISLNITYRMMGITKDVIHTQNQIKDIIRKAKLMKTDLLPSLFHGKRKPVDSKTKDPNVWKSLDELIHHLIFTKYTSEGLEKDDVKRIYYDFIGYIIANREHEQTMKYLSEKIRVGRASYAHETWYYYFIDKVGMLLSVYNFINLPDVMIDRLIVGNEKLLESRYIYTHPEDMYSTSVIDIILLFRYLNVYESREKTLEQLYESIFSSRENLNDFSKKLRIAIHELLKEMGKPFQKIPTNLQFACRLLGKMGWEHYSVHEVVSTLRYYILYIIQANHICVEKLKSVNPNIYVPYIMGTAEKTLKGYHAYVKYLYNNKVHILDPNNYIMESDCDDSSVCDVYIDNLIYQEFYNTSEEGRFKRRMDTIRFTGGRDEHCSFIWMLLLTLLTIILIVTLVVSLCNKLFNNHLRINDEIIN